MAINRGPFNALVDDDGTGTTGTPWNKAQIAGVILDPVDAALAATVAGLPVSALTLLGSGSGANTNPSSEYFASVTVPALGLDDRLLVQATAVNGSTGAVTIDLAAFDAGTTGYVALLRLTGTGAAGPMNSGNVLAVQATVHPLRPTATNVSTIATAILTYGTTPVAGTTFGALQVFNANAVGNALFLLHAGVTGGPLDWTWAVFLLKG